MSERKRRYYVINENDEWKVKLEEGRVLRNLGSDEYSYQRAISTAKELGRENRRPVMVNYKRGATGSDYYSVDDLMQDQ